MDATLDSARLNAPGDLKSSALVSAQTEARATQNNVGNSLADFRTVALERAVMIDAFDSLATRMVAQLEARGASKETINDARSYERKVQGRRAKAKAKDNPETPDIDESEKSISASQQSSAAKISTMYELLDFCEAQSEYADVTQEGLNAADVRDYIDTTQAKHDSSIVAAAKLSNDRISRNRTFYNNDGSICNLAARYKALVKGAYGAKSPEYKAVNAIPFKKPKM